MLTPIEIQGKVFKSGIGYDKKDVDAFFKEVLKSFETLYKENVENTDKISVLNDGIQNYKRIEKTLEKALVLAEKAAEETTQAAAEKAKSIENEAHNRASLIVSDAKNELNRVHFQTIELVQQYNKYKIQFQKMAETQIELLKSNGFNLDIANLDTMIAKGIDNLNTFSEKEENLSIDDNNDKKISTTTQNLYEEASATQEMESLKSEDDVSMKTEEDDFDFIKLDI